MKQKLTADIVKKATAEGGRILTIWDERTHGFFLRVHPGGKKVFGVNFRDASGAQRWPSCGDAFDEEGKVRLEDARQDAQKKLAEAKDEKASAERGAVPTIEEGIKQALELTRARESTKKAYQYSADVFKAWLEKKHPRVKTWAHLKPSMLTAYGLEFEQAKRQRDTIRLAVGFVRFAWGRMAADYPEEVLEPPKIRLPRKEKKEVECLEPAQVDRLLSWLKSYRPSLYPMAVLQALCGLRMLECAALRMEDVDLKAGTVHITETNLHTPKNPFSDRLIPIPKEAVEALRVAIDGGAVRIVRGEIFHNHADKPWDVGGLTKIWQGAMKAIAAKPREVKRRTGILKVHSDGLNDSTFTDIPARKLRASFVSMAGRLGAPDRLLKSYVGHSPEDILGKHYRAIRLDELKAVAQLMDGWRDLAKQDAEKSAAEGQN